MSKFGWNTKRFIVVLLGLTVVAHLVIIYNVRRKEEKQKKLVRDYEEVLCNFRLHRGESELYQERQECPGNGIVTVFYAGGLYSQMWAYSSVWAISRITRLKPYIPLCMYNFLSKTFEELTIPPLTSIAECDIPLPAAAQSYESWLGSNQSIVLPIFSRMTELALPRLVSLITEFRIKENLLKEGEGILREFARDKFEVPVYVGVHLPKNWLSFADGLLYPEMKFFRNIFERIRNQNTNAIFVIVSDDEVNQFEGEDILFVKYSGPFGLDLALLSLCNMSVVGYDDIGVWGAILTEGDTVVFDDTEGKFEEYLRLMPKWKVFG